MESPMTVSEDLWSARLPNGDVRSGTLEQLDEAFRSGHLGGDTLVCAARSDRWVTLADAMAGARAGVASAAVAAPRASVGVPRPSVPAPVASVPAPSVAPQPVVAQPVSPRVNGSPEVWQVRLANGEVRSGTREQLAEALHGGHLDEHVLVLAAEAREWVPLGVVMRRSEAPAPVAFVPAPVAFVPAPAAFVPPSVAPPAVAPIAPSVAPRRVVPQAVAPQVASAPPPSPADDGREQVWQVKLADGQVRSGTREQLEEAFNAGHIDQAALVLAAGASEWVTLTQMMAPEPPPVAAQPAAPIVAQEPEPESALAPPAVAAPAIPSSDLASSVMAPPAVASLASAPEEEPAASASNGSAPLPVQPDLQAAWDGDGPWQVNLSSKQLKQAFYEGVLDDDTPVRAAGSDEWTRLGDARRTPSASSASPPDSDATPATNGAIADGDVAGASLHESA
jgi:hypothetical protein